MGETFYTIPTNIGKAAIANASAMGKKVDFKYMALGDGDGKYYNPTEIQTELKNEVYRAQINHVIIDEKNPNWIKIAIVIPTNVGGFTVREVGVFDTEGNMLAVGKYPETYKPIVESGSSKDLTINMILEVANSEVVNLKIDPTVILATKKDIQVLRNDLDIQGDQIKKNTEDIAAQTADLANLEKDFVAHQAETVKKTGDTMTGALATYSDSIVDYKNVLHFSRSNITGILKIKMPKTWSGTRFTARLQGYNNAIGQAVFTLELGGMNVESYWAHPTAILQGTAPFTKVRYGHDGDTCCILLGDVNTFWTFPKITIESFKACDSNITGWETGWSAEFITDITSVTDIVEPTIKYGGIHSSGSNANGEWIRFEDGTQICMRNFTFNRNTNDMTATMPSTFVKVLGVSLGLGTIGYTDIWDAQKLFTGTNNISWRIHKGEDAVFKSTEGLPILLFAIGRWK